MSRIGRGLLLLSGMWLLGGCATYHRQGLDPEEARRIEQSPPGRDWTPAPELREKILALDPENVTADQVRDILSRAPAPRIISIHGGIYPVHRRMISFSRFLMGMGYPGTSLMQPGDGTYTFSCYESSAKIAGSVAWYYEREGLRPVLVGHSQGGFTVVQVLQKLAQPPTAEVRVWNPLTWQREARGEIIDPASGRKRPVAGLQLGYATSMGAGGLTRLLPNQWDMCGRLRRIPDSVEEFTGFYKGKDLLGGDFLGYGPANLFHPNGTARVRNVRLPSSYRHGAVPDTEHLLKSEPMMDWIHRYRPGDPPPPAGTFDGDGRHIEWAADVWFSLKRHWVRDLQRLIRSRAADPHGL